VIERLKRTVRVATRDQKALHVRIGRESMSDEQIAENARAVLDAVEHRIGESAGVVGAVQIKTTMGKPVKLEA
jgi:large subunit ribosomal protein L1